MVQLIGEVVAEHPSDLRQNNVESLVKSLRHASEVMRLKVAQQQLTAMLPFGPPARGSLRDELTSIEMGQVE